MVPVAVSAVSAVANVQRRRPHQPHDVRATARARMLHFVCQEKGYCPKGTFDSVQLHVVAYIITTRR